LFIGRSLDEGDDLLRRPLGLLDDEPVPRAWDADAPGARHELGVPVDVLVRDDPVVLGPDDQRRHPEPREAPRQLRVVMRRPGEAREADHLAVRVHDVVQARAVGEVVEVLGLSAAEEARRDPLGRHGEEVDERLPWHVEAGRRDERQALQPFRVEDREARRDPAADGEAHAVEALETQRIGEVPVVEDEVVELHAPPGRLGLSEARLLGGDEVDRRRHSLVERQPHARGAGAVQEERGLARALAAVGDPDVADVDPLRLRVEEPGPRHRCRTFGHRASSRRKPPRSGARSYSTSSSNRTGEA
jgi:hypothetical protein